MNVPQVLTLTEVADFLGISGAAVAVWARDGLLPVCAHSESGELMFYRWRVERDGPKLAAGEVVRFRKANRRRESPLLHDGQRLPCGCLLVSTGNGAEEPVWLCPDARALQSIERLAAAFAAAAAPDDPLLSTVARVTADALVDHLAPAKHAVETAAEPNRLVSGSPAALSSETAREAHVT